MPIIKSSSTSSKVHWALWEISESYDELLALYPLTEKDLILLEEIKVETRKKEWLAARLALKHLLVQLEMQGCSIFKDEFGKPHLSDSTAGISLSHATDFGAAALNFSGAVGIDIEHSRDKISRIARKFLAAEEADWTRHEIPNLTKVWSAKEALYKLHGRTQLIFAEQLLVEAPNAQGMSVGWIKEHNEAEQFELHFCLESPLLCTVAS